ncbi:MAG TPA: protein kinase [Polyangiaceae bacterium]|nr:protein kinase [Polyangiaceae bacterium]
MNVLRGRIVVGICPQCGRARETSYRFCPQCGFPVEHIEASPNDPLIGRVLGQAYVLLEKVGTGGMGAVYRAEQRTLGRTVAVKVIHAHLLHDPGVGDRFFNEAHAASRLSHPHLVSVIDFGKTEDGLPYLVMEYLRGRDLRSLLQEEGPLELSRALTIFQQVLEALAEAHALGVVHRDLKPANIVVEQTRAGCDFVKVVDFGLAKIIHGSSERALVTGDLVRGTPCYMAPEQAMGGAIDPRTDIYAAGVTLFELLTGRPPFEARSPMELMLDHLNTAPPDPRTLAPSRHLPAALVTACLRALSKKPDERYQSAEDFLRDLRGSDMSLDEAGAYPTIPVPGRAASCPSCGEPLTSSQKFCGACGERIPSGPPLSGPQSPSRPRLPDDPQSLFAPQDNAHLLWLQQLRLSHTTGTKAVRLVGPHGSGKTSILRDVAAFARMQGDAVGCMEPDPWWAEPSEYSLRHLILQLVRLPEDGKDPLSWAGAWPEAVLGLQTLFLTTNASSPHSPETLRAAACAALQWAIERAAQSALSGHVLVLADDLERIDGVSRNALADALALPIRVPWLLMVTHVPRQDIGWRYDLPERVLQGIPVESARHTLRAIGARDDVFEGQSHVLPLLVEQHVRAEIEGHNLPPMGLADVISYRMAALPLHARMVLDALGILGDDVPMEHLNQVVDHSCDVNEGLRALAVSGFIDRRSHGLCWVNPLFREVAKARIPAALRIALSERAADVCHENDRPVEARAAFALEAGRGLEALFLLEYVARSAKSHGNDEGAARALKQGVDLARQTPPAKGIDQPQHAAVLFGRKLGETLLDLGQLAQSRQVLQQALELADGDSEVDVLRALARVARAENRSGEAQAFLKEAITRAKQTGRHEVLDSLVELERKWAS